MTNELTGALLVALKHATVLRTSDGYTFTKDGEAWTDGDLTYATLRQLIEAVEGEVEVISCAPASMSPLSLMTRALKHANVLESSAGYTFHRVGEAWHGGALKFRDLSTLIQALDCQVEVLSCSPRGAVASPGSSPTVDPSDLSALTLAIKAEVLTKMQQGTIPAATLAFSALHDHCDANCLGGLCDDATMDAMIERFGGRDEHEGMPQGMLDLINAAQDAVSTWLADRWPASLPLRLDKPFSNAEGTLGSAWSNMATEENVLAELLLSYPKGVASVHGSEAWFLMEQEHQLVLAHGTFTEGVVSDVSSRFDFDLEWIDIDEASLTEYAQSVREAYMAMRLVAVTVAE